MDGWLTDPKGYWITQFHKDPSSTWGRDQRVLVDHGRLMSGGEPTAEDRQRAVAGLLLSQLVNKGWTMPLLIRH